MPLSTLSYFRLMADNGNGMLAVAAVAGAALYALYALVRGGMCHIIAFSLFHVLTLLAHTHYSTALQASTIWRSRSLLRSLAPGRLSCRWPQHRADMMRRLQAWLAWSLVFS